MRGSYRTWHTAPAEATRITPSTGPAGANSIEIEYRVLGEDLSEIRPAADLDEGEYVLAAPLQGQRWAVVAYDFGIGAAR